MSRDRKEAVPFPDSAEFCKSLFSLSAGERNPPLKLLLASGPNRHSTCYPSGRAALAGQAGSMSHERPNPGTS